MATRAYIFKIDNNREAHGVFLFQDGYPSYAGKVLTEHYNKEEQVNELISNPIYSLNETIDNCKFLRENDATHNSLKVDGLCYLDLKNEIIEKVRNELTIEWLYVFNENKEWEIYHLADLFGKRKTKQFANLENAILEED